MFHLAKVDAKSNVVCFNLKTELPQECSYTFMVVVTYLVMQIGKLIYFLQHAPRAEFQAGKISFSILLPTQQNFQ